MSRTLRFTCLRIDLACEPGEFDVVVDIGDYERKRRVLRLSGVRAPSRMSKRFIERRAAVAVRDWVYRRLERADRDAIDIVLFESVKTGVWVGDVMLADDVSLVHLMVAEGVAVAGIGPREWTDDEFNSIYKKCEADRARNAELVDIRAVVTSPTKRTPNFTFDKPECEDDGA